MRKFELDITNGDRSPLGTITLKPGLSGNVCEMRVREGYHPYKEASIDLTFETAERLIEYLQSVVKMEKASGEYR